MTPRVLHVSQATGYGLTRYLSALVTDQASRGWELALASPHDPDLERLCADLGVRHHHWPARRSPGPSVFAECVRLRRIVRAVDPDVVHLHSSKAGLVGRLVVRRRRPTIFTPHAWSFLAEGAFMRWASRCWERLGARWTTVTLCVSDSERSRGEAAGVRSEYRVVPNSVDLDAFAPASADERASIRARLEVTEPMALCVGRLAPQKGQDVLLDVWPAVRREVPGAELVLLGDGPDRDELVRRGVEGVRFLGQRDDVRDWLIAADVVVQPSRWEAGSGVVQSLATLEAMACARSVVTTAVAGLDEPLGHDGASYGALVAIDDADGWCEAIVRRLADPSFAVAEGGRARAHVESLGFERWGTAIADVTLEVFGSRV